MVHLAYTTVSCPVSTYQPADSTDVSRLSALLHALPALRVVEIQAMRRDVLLERVGHYEHLSLACADICIPPCEAAAVARLKSLHLVFETGHPETVCPPHGCSIRSWRCFGQLEESGVVQFSTGCQPECAVHSCPCCQLLASESLLQYLTNQLLSERPF